MEMKNKQEGWGWLNGEGYCNSCATYGLNEKVQPFTDGGFAVDYCCNCGAENPNHAEEKATELKKGTTFRHAILLDPETKEPRQCVVTSVRQGRIYFRPMDVQVCKSSWFNKKETSEYVLKVIKAV